MQEKRELEKLAKRDAAAESKEYWKAEIAQLFRELHEQFDTQLVDYRNELVAQIDAKVGSRLATRRSRTHLLCKI